MADDLQPFLRARMSDQDFFVSPQGGGDDSPPLPLPNPAQQRRRLLDMLDRLVESSVTRPDGSRVTGADREIIAVRAVPGAPLAAGGLADKREDVQVAWQDQGMGLVLLDAPSANLRYLRRKISEFGDDSRVTEKGARKNAPVVAPIDSISLASLDDVAGPKLQAALGSDLSFPRWFEIACRGGTRNSSATAAKTREEMTIAFALLQRDIGQEYMASERLLFYTRLNIPDLRTIVSLVDCIFEVEIVEPDIRSWLTFGDPPFADIRGFRLDPPGIDAPAVVLMDTGIISNHPMLGSAILSSTSVVVGDDSPADTHGHGTRMAGVALFDDLAAALEERSARADHWIQSVRLLTRNNSGESSEVGRPYWPTRTTQAVESSEQAAVDGNRVFVLATSAVRDMPRGATSWSDAADRLAYNGGQGRLLCVAAGNAPSMLSSLLVAYPRGNLEFPIEDPAQAKNVSTVGAYTSRTALPPDPTYDDCSVLAPSGGISPHTTCGEASDAIKPEILLEGGNIAFNDELPDATLATLVTVTTGHEVASKPLGLLSMTSSASAECGRLAARVWAQNSWVRPETVRALLVHSARWTPAMQAQFPDLSERLRACGYGVPNLTDALGCTSDRATIIIEDEIANTVRDGSKPRRLVKFFELPIPEAELLDIGTAPVELTVTLSYFSEPNTFRGHTVSGLDLRWDMQGPVESDTRFRERINKLARTATGQQNWDGSFQWQIGKTRRSRGTVQSDRWEGPATALAGSKLIAVYPKLGWWDRRPTLAQLSQPFSLAVTVRVPDLDIYTSVSQMLAIQVDAT